MSQNLEGPRQDPSLSYDNLCRQKAGCTRVHREELLLRGIFDQRLVLSLIQLWKAGLGISEEPGSQRWV